MPEEKVTDRELKLEALRSASNILCSPVITQAKYENVVDLAEQIYKWLKQ